MASSPWVVAQANSPSTAANTMKLSPLRTDLTMQPGETKTVQIHVTNPSSFDISVTSLQNDFIADGEDGTPALILEEGKFAETHSLKKFMQPIADKTIAAGQSEAFDVTIVVPEDAEPGGYFGAVRFVPTTPESGGQVNLSISTASLILLTVEGKTTEKLHLTDFTTRQNGRVGSFFTDSGNLDIVARFQNKGKVQAGPFGKLIIKKGDEVVYESDFNEKAPRDVVLPSSARRWTIPVESVEGFGKYEIYATFTHGSNNQTLEATSHFWVMPKSIIIGAAAGLLLIVGTIIGLIVRHKKSKNDNKLAF